MKQWTWVASGVLLAACKNDTPIVPAAETLDAIAVTRWTEKTELFMEYPALISGQKARFAVHLTDLGSFKPLSAGRVTVELRSAAGSSNRFQTDAPSRPGIFGVDVRPSAAGRYSMVVRLDSSELHDVHPIGPVEVYADAQAAASSPQADEEGAIRYLKEQQWTLDFATEVVAERDLRESLRVPAQVRPRTGGEVEVVAVVTGRLAAADAIPSVGTAVQQGQLLTRIIPRTAIPADRAALQLGIAEATAALGLARQDRERAERLYRAGAVPGKRLEQATAAEATAQARLEAAQALMTQHESSRSGAGDLSSETLFLLRAPIAGVLAMAHATAGASVEEGEALFRIVATDPVHVVAHLPEAQSSWLDDLAGGELELAGAAAQPLNRIVSIGQVVDPASRSLLVIFETRNADAELAIGQSVWVRLFTTATNRTPAVPESALVDDGGQPVVFVQIAGESFARQAVSLGSREAGYVQVLNGLRPGDRIVTRGAYQIRLAALSTQLPAHGHLH